MDENYCGVCYHLLTDCQCQRVDDVIKNYVGVGCTQPFVRMVVWGFFDRAIRVVTMKDGTWAHIWKSETHH